MWDELRRPATALWAIGIIISIIIALYFYKKAERVGQIVIDVEQIQIFDRTRSGVVPLTVLDSAGHTIDNNVYAASITIWNSGNAEVKKEDVREPVRLAVQPEEGATPPRMLDISPYFHTRNNIDGFSVNGGEISWQHFDAGEGLKVRAVYVSSTPKFITLVGYVAGSKIINRQQLEAQRAAFNNIATPFGLWCVGILISLGALIGSMYTTVRKLILLNVISMVAGTSAGALILYYWEWGQVLSKPPF